MGPGNVARSEELRLALVMNGGVSLSIWVGGVSHEINRFVGETHPVYAGLLELTSTRARVDVISGTSAGGINGAALALASVHDTSVYPLRDLWLSKGAFSALLRSAGQKDPPSLLDGDEYFLPALEDAFSKLVKSKPRSKEAAPMDLALTATMLRGEPNSRLDDLGEVIEDSHHRALFHLRRGPNDDQFATQEIAKVVANAARASASFPVAFEPRFYPKELFENASTQQKAKLDRYLIDGGVLDNKPLRSALKAIFGMPTVNTARRVLAYVVPDPASSAVDASDRVDDPPTVSEVAIASLLGIPSLQAISDQLREIDEHNRAVGRQRHTFSWLASHLTPAQLQAMAANVFPAYRERRIDGLLDFVLDEISAAVSAAGGTSWGRHTRNWLKAVWQQSTQAQAAWADVIPSAADSGYDLESKPLSWNWGLYTVQFVASLALDLMRRTQRLAPVNGAATTAVPAMPQHPSALAASAGSPASFAADAYDWDARDESERTLRSHAGPLESVAGPLEGLWNRLYVVLHNPRFNRRLTSEKIRQSSASLLTALATVDSVAVPGPAPAGADFDAGLVAWLKQGLSVAAQDKLESALLAAELASVLLELAPAIKEVLDSPRQLRPEEEASRQELRHLYSLLLAGVTGRNQVMKRLLQLEVCYYALAGRSERIDAAVELVQISARGQSPWGGPASPTEKLTGMQLAHFGAFYRRSWRANDWMMGRLDGIGHIVRVALNPDRLQRLYAGTRPRVGQDQLTPSDYVYRYLEALAIGAATPSHQSLLSSAWEGAKIKAELAFLDSPTARAAETLPACVAALTRRLHLEVLCKELPEIAASIGDDVAAGAVPGTSGGVLVERIRPGAIRGRRDSLLARFLAELRLRPLPAPTPPATLDPTTALHTFRTCGIGGELLRQEAGSDLMTRTAAQTLAVVHSALIGDRSGMAKLGGLLKVLTLPIRFFHLLANRLVRDSRTSAAIGTAVLVSGFLMLLGSALIIKPPELLAPVAWSMLLGWFATTAMRQMDGLKVGVILLSLMLALLVAVGDLRQMVTPLLVVGTVALGVWTPGWVFGLLASLATLWWTTGHPALSDIGAALCDRAPAWAHCSIGGNPIPAALFVRAVGPLSATFALSWFGQLVNRRRLL